MNEEELLIVRAVVKGMSKFMRDMDRLDNKVEGNKTKWMGLSNVVGGAVAVAFGTILVRAIETVIIAFMRLGRVALGAITESVNMAADFETAVTNISLVVAEGIVPAEEWNQTFSEMHDVALALGRDERLVGIGATEAAEGLEILFKAGLDATQILGPGGIQGVIDGTVDATGAFKASADLAATSTLSLERASNLAVVTLSTFGKEADDQAAFVEDAFDIMTRAASSSTADISDYEQALSNVASTAVSMGFDIEETTQAISIMADNGIRGAEAGTALRRMMANLNRDTKGVNEAMSDLGVSLFDEAGNMKDLDVIMREFGAALQGTEERTLHLSNRTAEQNFLYEEARGIYESTTEKLMLHNAGLNVLSDEGLEKTIAQQAEANRVIGEMEDVGTRAVQVSGQLTEEQRLHYVQTLAGVYGQNAFNSLLADFNEEGELTRDNFADINDQMSDQLSLSDRVTKITETYRGQQEILNSEIETFKILLGEALLPVLKTFVDLVIKFVNDHGPELESVFQQLGQKLLGLEEPMIKLFGFIENLIFGTPNAIDQVSALKDKFFETAGVVMEYLNPSLSFIEEMFGLMIPLAIDIFTTYVETYIMPMFYGIIQIVEEGIMPIIDTLTEGFDKQLPEAMLALYLVWFGYIKPAFEWIQEFISEKLVPVIINILGAIRQWIEILMEVSSVVGEIFRPLWEALAEWFEVIMMPILSTLWDWFNQIIDIIVQLSAWINETYLPTLKDLWKWINEKIVPILKGLFEIFALVFGIMTQVARLTLQFIRWGLKALWKEIDEHVIPQLEIFDKWLMKQLKPAFEWFNDTGLPAFETWMGKIREGIGWVVEKMEALKEALGKVKEALSGLEIPEDWRPGSPPPFYYALGNVSDAMDKIAFSNIPNLASSLQSIQAPAGSGSNVGNVSSVENNTSYNLSTSTLLEQGELALEFKEMELSTR